MTCLRNSPHHVAAVSLESDVLHPRLASRRTLKSSDETASQETASCDQIDKVSDAKADGCARDVMHKQPKK